MIGPAAVAVQSRRGEGCLLLAATAIAVALVGAGVGNPASTRLVLAVCAMLLVAALGLMAPSGLLFLLVGWLAVLGLVRRVASLVLPESHTDPLLLIEAAAVAVLLCAAVARGGFGVRSTLSKAILALALLVLAGSLNPAQGAITTGAAGLLFGLVPICGFWIGRAFCDDRTYGRILGFVAIFGVATALYGLRQTFAGFPPWDAGWIRESGYEALHVGGVTRAFGTFSSASEYGGFIAIALVAWIVYGRRLARTWLSVPIVILLFIALVYESSRGVMFLLPVALILMWTARFRRPLALSLTAAAAAVLLIPVVVSHLAPAAGSTQSNALIQHQLSGLRDPLSSSSSTLSVHASLVVEGLRTALRQPLGVGSGAVTIAGTKFGGQNRGTEADPSNAAVALGIPGLIAYIVVLVAGFRRAYALAATRSDGLSLIALGILVVTVLQWLNGGQYAVALLVWLTLGWVDRASESTDRDVIEEPAGGVLRLQGAGSR